MSKHVLGLTVDTYGRFGMKEQDRPSFWPGFVYLDLRRISWFAFISKRLDIGTSSGVMHLVDGGDLDEDFTPEGPAYDISESHSIDFVGRVITHYFTSDNPDLFVSAECIRKEREAEKNALEELKKKREERSKKEELEDS